MEIDIENKTFRGIPLSVIYKQIIRFMKEIGIYSVYVESFSKTDLTYETFLERVYSYGDMGILNFFIHKHNRSFLKKLRGSKILYDVHFGLINHIRNLSILWTN